MRKVLLIGLIFLSANMFAQDTLTVRDPEAKKILDKVSARYEKFNTIRLYFQYQVYDNKDQDNRLKEKYTGWLYVEGQDKYKLLIPGIEIFSDGTKIYTLDKKNKELTVTWYDPQSESILTPQKLLYIYDKGYKYLYRGEATFDTKVSKNGKIVPQTRTMYIVDLYPEDPRKSAYSIVRIWIDKSTYQIVSIKYQANNGVDVVVDILEEKDNVAIPEQMFVYDPSKLPKDIEINDFTED